MCYYVITLRCNSSTDHCQSNVLFHLNWYWDLEYLPVSLLHGVLFFFRAQPRYSKTFWTLLLSIFVRVHLQSKRHDKSSLVLRDLFRTLRSFFVGSSTVSYGKVFDCCSTALPVPVWFLPQADWITSDTLALFLCLMGSSVVPCSDALWGPF